jgi:hypothetical protein
VKRILSPSLNPAGLGAAIAAIYAAVVMIVNAAHHHGIIDPQVLVAALSAAAFLYARMKVTPVADPRDGNGRPLVPGLPVTPAVTAPVIPPTGAVTVVPPGQPVQAEPGTTYAVIPPGTQP